MISLGKYTCSRRACSLKVHHKHEALQFLYPVVPWSDMPQKKYVHYICHSQRAMKECPGAAAITSHHPGAQRSAGIQDVCSSVQAYIGRVLESF